jgi:TetR/AcrR family transcriptional repressor of lmrAB and yxaGH operons
MAANLERSGYREGCPIAPTALETATHSKALGAAARKAFQSWEREIRRGLERFGLKAAEAERAATAVLSLLEGARCSRAPIAASSRCSGPRKRR